MSGRGCDVRVGAWELTTTPELRKLEGYVQLTLYLKVQGSD
jgi:hypothetical protein